MANKKKVLVVDDRKSSLSTIKGCLSRDKKYVVFAAHTVDEALDILENQEVDLVISGLHSSSGLLSELRNWDTSLPVIFTGSSGEDDESSAICGDPASSLIPKPFRKESLLRAVQTAL